MSTRGKIVRSLVYNSQQATQGFCAKSAARKKEIFKYFSARGETREIPGEVFRINWAFVWCRSVLGGKSFAEKSVGVSRRIILDLQIKRVTLKINMTLNIPIPENLDEAFVKQLAHEVREFVGARLYQEGKLSHGQLAKYLGIGRGQVDEVLGRHGIVDEFSADEIQAPLKSSQKTTDHGPLTTHIRIATIFSRPLNFLPPPNQFQLSPFFTTISA